VTFPSQLKTKNLFLSLAESINQTLNVALCYLCGGTNIGKHWPWEDSELNSEKHFNETTLSIHGESIWLLKIPIMSNYCISHPKG
jgi:hypothetical protein